MKEIVSQHRNGILYPSSDTDRETIVENYKTNQLLRTKLYLISKQLEPSVAQNNTMHACFKLVADNHPDVKSQNHAKFLTKVALDFRHLDKIAVRPDGCVQFDYRSFSFAELKNMERLNIFNRAFEYLAGLLGISVEEMIAEAKKRMRSF